MAFFTRTKSTVPVLPGEEGDEILSEDEWEDELEERRTPDGRSSKTSYELRREGQNNVVECKNPCLEEPKDDTKTDEVRYEIGLVDRTLGVQV